MPFDRVRMNSSPTGWAYISNPHGKYHLPHGPSVWGTGGGSKATPQTALMVCAIVGILPFVCILFAVFWPIQWIK